MMLFIIGEWIAGWEWTA